MFSKQLSKKAVVTTEGLNLYYLEWKEIKKEREILFLSFSLRIMIVPFFHNIIIIINLYFFFLME